MPLIYFSTKREKEITVSDLQLQIPDAAASSEPTPVKYCEFVPDAYEAILTAEKEGLITKVIDYE